MSTKNSPRKSNVVPRLDLSKLDFDETKYSNSSNSSKLDSKISSQKPPDKTLVVKETKQDIKSPKKEVVYKNKQVFYKTVEEKTVLTPKKTKKAKGKFWYLDEVETIKSPSIPETNKREELMNKVAQLQAEYVNTPYTNYQQVMKSLAENDVYKKQQDEVIEQVLADLLSRHVISDVEQDLDPARQNPASTTSLNVAPLRNKSRRLHDTKVSTSRGLTESNLKDRITFAARILTQDGRDALRELFGFYFHIDSSLVVYEFRLFGKKTLKALPLIEIGNYRHINGRNRGRSYDQNDFQLAKNLTFNTFNQPHLPDSLKKSGVLTLRVCDVITCSGPENYSFDDEDIEEEEDRKIAAKVQKDVRKSIIGRSLSVVIGLGKLFRQLDRSGDGRLSRDELVEALNSFNINITPQDFESVWRTVDENDDGSISYGEFLRTFIGEMNERRKFITRKVFKKLDPHKNGSVNLLDIRKLYSAKKHPFVSKGLLSQAEMEETFIKSLSEIISSRDQNVSFVEFEEYYEGISLSVKNDEDFINIMRNCWGV